MNDVSMDRAPLPGVIQYKVSETSSGVYDAIIVGGGHNGLTCAAFLAKAGKRVLVLEARDVVGGLAWTREMTNAPGFQVNPCGMELLLVGFQPSVIDQLDLAKYGLKFVYPKALTTGLFPDGTYMPFYQDLEKTVAHIRTMSPRDADKYRELIEAISAVLFTALPYFQGHPFRIKPGMVYETLKMLLKHGPRKVARGARIMLSSMESVLEEYFVLEQVKATLGTYSSASFGPMSEPGGGVYMTVLTLIHKWGHRRPVGGTGQFTRALAACVVDHGGEVRVNAPVAQINVRNGRAVGVVLKNGEEIQARQVVGATDPYTLATKLIDPKDLPQSTHDQVRAMQSLRHGIYIYKADMALSGPPKLAFGFDKVDPDVTSTLTLCTSMDNLRKSAYLGMTGEYSDTNIPLTTIMPSAYDRTMVPPGSKGESLFFYAYNTPVELSGGRKWEDESERYFQKLLDMFEMYAPNTRELILDTYLTSPSEFESRYNVHRGNYSHVDMTPTQMGPWRPFRDFAGFKTPIDGLWNAASGSFPLAYMSGWPGRSAAREVVRTLNKNKG